METLGNKKTPKNPKKYNCVTCMFNTCNLKDYKKHIETIKHKKRSMETFGNKKTPNLCEKTYFCDCGMIFISRAGLWKHHKTCGVFSIKNTQDDSGELNKDMLIEIIKKNQEFQKDMQKQMLDFMKDNVSYNNSVNTINNLNSNNKTFNLQFFLNETCKDAMNIMDFVKDIKINLTDLEDVGKLGYVDGISNIIINNLKGLEVNKRPVHCSDVKREVLYIKDEDHWSKEKEKMNYAIKHIAHKNIQMLPEWKEQNPTYSLNDGHKNDQFMQIVNESMGGSDKKEEQVYQEKIISKVAKHVIVDK